MTLRIETLTKRYGDTLAVDGVSLELGDAETLALVGPSGCGKSTLLRLIAGLEPPDAGQVWFDGENVTARPPQRRRVGMVFQDYALFPHLSVEQNVAFGLVELRQPKEEWRRRSAELLELVGLAGLQSRRIDQLSGGEQQRVALARALAPEPEVLLLDEPLSNLDLNLREALKLDLRKLLDSLGIRAIYVTHDQSEAFTVAERLAVMRSGTLVHMGPREAVLAQPRSAWVARFLGYRNVFEQVALGEVPDAPKAPAALLRADLIGLGGEVAAEVVALRRVGLLWELELHLPDWQLELHWSGFSRELPKQPQVGEVLRLRVPPEAWVPLEEA